MKFGKTMVLLGVMSLFTVFVSAGTVEGRGATFPNPLYKAWSAAYFKATRSRVSYIATDSGDGIAAVVKKEVDFGASDRPLSPEELEKKKLFVFPSAVGAIAIVYNLEGVKDGELKLSRKAIAAIFSGRVQFWDDPLIVKENVSLKLPHEPLKVIVRSDASGTTYNFTYFLHNIDKTIKPGIKQAWKIPDRTEVSSNADVWVGIHAGKNTIGYIEYSYKKRLKMDAAQIENREGMFVSPNVPSVHAALKHARWSGDNYYYTVITDPEGTDSYPIVASTFIFVPQEKSEKNKAVLAFLDWVYRYGDEKAIELGYVPLPETIKTKIRAFWKNQHLN
jgi:phosphate transport system substrate-binding protein